MLFFTAPCNLLPGMTLFTGAVRKADTQPEMAQPAYDDGPWGPAVQYWLNRLKWRQADLSRATGIEAKTISSIVRGFDTTTRMLRKIFDAIQIEARKRSPLAHIAFEEVLVSPDRKSEADRKKLWVQDIVERVARELEERSTLPLALPPAKPALLPTASDHPTMKELQAAVEAYADDPHARAKDAAAADARRQTEATAKQKRTDGKKRKPRSTQAKHKSNDR